MVHTDRFKPDRTYKQCSEYLSLDQDASLSIYRQFAALNTRNLLYLQTELADLEERIHKMDVWCDDRKDLGNDVWSIPRNWRNMRKAGKETDLDNERDLEAGLRPNKEPWNGGDRRAEAWKLSLELRSLLETYSKSSHQPILVI